LTFEAWDKMRWGFPRPAVRLLAKKQKGRLMQFSAMTMNMFFPGNDDPGDDNRIIEMAVAQSVWFAELGYHVWFTDHHFRGPWHSNPMQFAAYVAPLIPRDRYLGFGVLSIPFYHPVRLVESMNLLDQLTKGKVLFGVGSGWQGTEPTGLGVDRELHASGRLAEETLDVMERLWNFKYGDPEYSFSVGSNSGRIKKRIMPAPYSKPYPTIIRVASREAGLVRAAQKGRPAFLGVLGADLRRQMQLYRDALEEANHPQHVKDNCLRWCSYDWIGVTIAETDEEALAREKIARAETMAIRTSYVQRHGKMDGPAMGAAPGQSTADAYVKGDDMKATIAGTPDTIAAKVQQLAEMGINHLHLRFLGEWDGETKHICKTSAELFAKEVLPRFADVEVSSRLALETAR
jgi:alkanesulfonate monooxygenase SsuD/methylene tetrahydromethanopterin reductase-like flavin-dependent oxidoreductase (luciferase family)